MEKVNPEWQRGWPDGIGKIEASYASPAAAMLREFEEETGLRTLETPRKLGSLL